MKSITEYLSINKFSLNIYETQNMLITNKLSTDSFKLNVNENRIERTLSYKYFGVIVGEKLTWKENCKWLCFAT